MKLLELGLCGGHVLEGLLMVRLEGLVLSEPFDEMGRGGLCRRGGLYPRCRRERKMRCTPSLCR